jgi:hypothetical protein
LSVDAAVRTLHRLLSQARLKQLTGVDLKDDMDHQLGATTRPDQPPPENRLPWRE